jgi:hypothetical protein
MASPAFASVALTAGRIEIPLAVGIARAALAPMPSQPKRLGSLLAEWLTLPTARVPGIGIDQQHLGAVTRRGERDVQRGDAAVLIRPAPITAMTGGLSCRAPGQRARISRMALRNGHQRKARAQRRPAQPRDVGGAVGARMPPSVRITSVSCSRAISGFLDQADAGCGLGWAGGCFRRRRAVPSAFLPALFRG